MSFEVLGLFFLVVLGSVNKIFVFIGFIRVVKVLVGLENFYEVF